MKSHNRFICCAASVFVALIGLSACHSDALQKAEAPQAADNSIKTVTRKITGPQKPGAGVNIEYQLPEKIDAGRVIEIEFTFNAARDGELLVEVHSESLEVMNSQPNYRFNLAERREHKLPLSVYCGENGRFYLNVFVTQTSAQGQTGRQAYSIPVQVGTVAASKTLNESVKPDREGNLVRSLPAKETISEEEEK